jgi:hypothetical protein
MLLTSFGIANRHFTRSIDQYPTFIVESASTIVQDGTSNDQYGKLNVHSATLNDQCAELNVRCGTFIVQLATLNDEDGTLNVRCAIFVDRGLILSTYFQSELLLRQLLHRSSEYYYGVITKLSPSFITKGVMVKRL